MKILISGPQGSGKTKLVNSLLESRELNDRTFKHVAVFDEATEAEVEELAPIPLKSVIIATQTPIESISGAALSKFDFIYSISTGGDYVH